MRLVGGIADCKTQHILVMGIIIIVIYYLKMSQKLYFLLQKEPEPTN